MKSDEAKRKKLYVERARKFRYWNNLPFWAFTLTI